MVALLFQKFVTRLRGATLSALTSSLETGSGWGTPQGMVQLGSLTFRVVHMEGERYGIVRLLDDEFLGSFWCQPQLSVVPAPGFDPETLRAIARAAVQTGRTRWAPS